MSLNGLDASAVVEAHQSILADPGGWFLLKYTNRDTVDLLGRGNGGVTEAKASAEQYQEKSPLYGMVQYRRKRVLLKYVPDGTSRLLQVRLTVQFQSILDAFPHDTVFSFTAASELVESSLGMCTMLAPTTVGSLQQSSGAPLRQRRLNEISEDAEVSSTLNKREDIRVTKQEPEEDFRVFDPSDLSTLPASALRAKALLAKRKEEKMQAVSRSEIPAPTYAASTSHSILDQFPLVSSEPHRPFSALGQIKSKDEVETAALSRKIETPPEDERPAPYGHSRHLSENETANISQWNDQVAEYTLPPPKTKKKLAPRPHVESSSRPKTASFYDDGSSTRPVANMPQSVRISNRPSTQSLVRPSSAQSSRSVPARFLPASSIPPLPEFNQMQPSYVRPENRKAGSVASSSMTDAPNASPEKLRLMKALQNRKRTQILTQRAASAQPSFHIYRSDFPLDRPETLSSANGTTLPATIQEEPTNAARESKSAHGSSTASPTSVVTMSENSSTRPSSFAEDQETRLSQKSTSNDTDSSSTPKANPEIGASADKKRTNSYNLSHDLHNAVGTQNATGSGRLLDNEITRESQDLRTPTRNETRTEQETPTQQDRSPFPWLESESPLSVLQPAVQTGEVKSMVPSQVNPNLSLDTRVSQNLDASSALSDDDEDEADELHEATVHEATSMSVSRPPLTPTMRTYSHDRSRATTKSSLSLSLNQGHTPKSSKSTPSLRDKTPEQNLHSSSTALPQWPAGNDDGPMGVPLTKKPTLGHGISRRIKALEDSSRRDTSLSSSPPAHDASLTRSTFSNLMKRTSFIAQFQPPTLTPTSEKFSPEEVGKETQYDSGLGDRSATPRASHQTQQTPAAEPPKPKGKGNSVGLPKDRTSKHERQHSGATQASTVHDSRPTAADFPSTPSSEKKRFSFASSYRSGSNSKWMYSESMASRISLSNKENKHSRTNASETSSFHEEKHVSRTSRLMKRISGFGSRSSVKRAQTSSGREDSRPDPIMEQNEPHGRSNSVADSTMQMIDIGNVNVQFPETLLWKRRFLRIDDQGYLIFTAPTENPTAKSTSRKFHLGDIQEPCLPDLEREEMAWSVLLDLRDGNCIQCACESKQTQAKVLKMLLDAHSAYHSLYPDALE